MGNFAHSLHVRCDDAKAVFDAICKISEADYVVTNELPKRNLRRLTPSMLQANHVSAPHGGWVGILTSDELNAGLLTLDLSRVLKTVSLRCMLLNSESWHYEIYREGDVVDDFHSKGPGDLALHRDYPDGQTHWHVELLKMKIGQRPENIEPKEISEISEKHKAMGLSALTQQELESFCEWSGARIMRINKECDDTTREWYNDDQGGALCDDELDQHVANLRPLLMSADDDACVRDLLSTKGETPEEGLRQFLTFVGVQPMYARLNYNNMDQYDEAELAKEKIDFLYEIRLKFQLS